MEELSFLLGDEAAACRFREQLTLLCATVTLLKKTRRLGKEKEKEKEKGKKRYLEEWNINK